VLLEVILIGAVFLFIDEPRSDPRHS
jgi:hypothetical protein